MPNEPDNASLALSAGHFRSYKYTAAATVIPKTILLLRSLQCWTFISNVSGMNKPRDSNQYILKGSIAPEVWLIIGTEWPKTRKYTVQLKRKAVSVLFTVFSFNHSRYIEVTLGTFV